MPFYLKKHFLLLVFFTNLALINNVKQRRKLKVDKKRYVRTSKTGNLEWVGWKDRHIFPPGASDPTYLFFRPFNVLGDFFGETKLLEWIRINHLEFHKSAPCHKDQLGFREECLRELILPIAESNTVVMIPVNRDFLPIAANLRCSLHRLGITNIMHWSLDIQAHDSLLEGGKFKPFWCYFVNL